MSAVKEMTYGKPYRLILGFALPMIFGNVFQQLYSMVDTVIVGKYIGVDALAGVGSTGAVNFLVIGFALGICSGFSIRIAQSFGAGDYVSMRKFIANSFYLCGIAAVILTAVTMLLTKPILSLMDTPKDIFPYAYSYIIVIFGGISATIFYNLLAGILRALGDSRTPLMFLIIASLINIALDLLFIIVFRLGVTGAGLATVISQGVSGILCLFYMKRNYEILSFEKEELVPDGEKAVSLLSVGIPMALQFSITAIGSIILQRSVNGLGKVPVASVTAAMKIQTIAIAVTESIGITMATYCGQNMGAGKYSRIRAGIRQSIVMSMIYCVIACLAVSTLGGFMTRLFVDSGEKEILSLSLRCLRLNGVFYPMLGILFIMRNSLQGMGYSFLPMLAGVSELAARVLVSLILVPVFGFDAACLAGPVAWIFADVLLITTYFIKMKELKRIIFRRKKVNAANG